MSQKHAAEKEELKEAVKNRKMVTKFPWLLVAALQQLNTLPPAPVKLFRKRYK
jgi:hypothetical protein